MRLSAINKVRIAEALGDELRVVSDAAGHAGGGGGPSWSGSWPRRDAWSSRGSEADAAMDYDVVVVGAGNAAHAAAVASREAGAGAPIRLARRRGFGYGSALFERRPVASHPFVERLAAAAPVAVDDARHAAATPGSFRAPERPHGRSDLCTAKAPPGTARVGTGFVKATPGRSL